jgi:hypothetical protein
MTNQTKWPEDRFAATNDKPSAMVRVSPPSPSSASGDDGFQEISRDLRRIHSTHRI